MKKIIFSTTLLATSLFALSDAELLSIYAGAPQDIKITISNKTPVKGLDKIQAVEYTMSKGDMSQSEIMFADEKFIYPDIIDPKSGISYKTQMENEIKNAKVGAEYAKESADYIIKIGNDPKKETLVIFTDAECPYCRREMANIEKRLETNNIEIIMASVHGASAHAKSFKIYEEVKNAKTDSEKVAILHKYYDEKMMLKDGEVSAENVQKMADLAAKYFKAGIHGVPNIINKSDIVKK